MSNTLDKDQIPANLTFGYVTTTDSFDPASEKELFDKRVASILENDISKRFTGISFQVPPDTSKLDIFLEMVADCKEKGLNPLPIFMCGQETNPLNPTVREAAIENWGNFCTAVHKSGCEMAMGPFEEWAADPTSQWGKDDPNPLPKDVVAERIESGAIVVREGAKVLPADTNFKYYCGENLIFDEQKTLNSIDRELNMAQKANEMLKEINSPLTYQIIVDTAHNLKLDRSHNRLDDPLPEDIANSLDAAAKAGIIGLAHISRPGERDNPLAGGYPLKSWLFKLWNLGVFVRQDIEMFNRFDFLVDNLTELTTDKCDYNANDVWTPSIKTLEQTVAWYEEWKASKV
jgi:hypothetical protein